MSYTRFYDGHITHTTRNGCGQCVCVCVCKAVRSKPEVVRVEEDEEEEKMDEDTWRPDSLDSDCDTEDEVERYVSV